MYNSLKNLSQKWLSMTQLLKKLKRWGENWWETVKSHIVFTCLLGPGPSASNAPAAYMTPSLLFVLSSKPFHFLLANLLNFIASSLLLYLFFGVPSLQKQFQKRRWLQAKIAGDSCQWASSSIIKATNSKWTCSVNSNFTETEFFWTKLPDGGMEWFICILCVAFHTLLYKWLAA